MRFSWTLAATVVALSLAVAPASAQSTGNVVTEWSAIAATATAGQPAHVQPLTLSIVHGAVYDAVNAIDGGHQPYLAAPPAQRSDSQDAAAATAAFRVLSVLFPLQASTLQPLYGASLARVPDGPAKAGGIAVGEAAATAMLAARANDGRGGPFTFTFGSTPGAWRPTISP